MKLLTFLGVGSYQETTYTWQDQSTKCRFAPVASKAFLQPETIIVFLTEEADQHVYPDFQDELSMGTSVKKRAVPLGSSESELWQIFETVSATVEPGESVAFDITHGLRSFPLIGLLAAAYLRAAHQVQLEAVLYGAYDVGLQISPGRTPMFDLSPMLSLLEWAAAAERFNQVGDARGLSNLLAEQRVLLAKGAQGDRARLEQIGSLGNLAGALNSISQSLRLIRPHQASESIAGLPERIDLATDLLQQTAPAQPFIPLLRSVEETYQGMGQSNPLAVDNLPKTLKATRRMVRWYADREQWVQAVALAREWLLSWTMAFVGLRDITEPDGRRRTETVLNAEAKAYRDSRGQTGSIFLASVPNVNQALDLWSQLTNVRNDALHAGMRRQPLDHKALVKQLTACIDQLEQLPLPGDTP